MRWIVECPFDKGSKLLKQERHLASASQEILDDSSHIALLSPDQASGVVDAA